MVALDSLAPAHGMGWYYSNVWLARELHGITLADRLPFWPGQYLVCASAHSEDPRRNSRCDASLEQSIKIRYNHAGKHETKPSIKQKTIELYARSNRDKNDVRRHYPGLQG